jgi:2-oxoglutarate ferredoxin oxidoreductase subunit beta
MHSTAHKIIAELMDEMNLREKVCMVLPVGCSILAGMYWNFDMIYSVHGRASAVATGFKRGRKNQPVIVYQGDGDAASIGIAETLYAANRGEPLTVIMINNQIYGMTGGQTSPTTLLEQKTTTAIYGRKAEEMGYPVKMAELIAQLGAPRYVTRVSLHTPKYILQAKKAIKKGLDIQINENGYSFIEVLSACPTNWKIPTDKTPEYMEKYVIPEFPLGEFKNI